MYVCIDKEQNKAKKNKTLVNHTQGETKQNKKKKHERNISI